MEPDYVHRTSEVSNTSARLRPIISRPRSPSPTAAKPGDTSNRPNKHGFDTPRQTPAASVETDKIQEVKGRIRQMRRGAQRRTSNRAKWAYMTGERTGVMGAVDVVGRRNALDYGRPGSRRRRRTVRTAPRKGRQESRVPEETRANSSMAAVGPTTTNINRKDRMDGLTDEQILAFQEVFDLFDSNGGGTIDADELDTALRSVDICLTQSEICDVLVLMDKDGNGEIDFLDFLQLMTNTERFIEAISEGSTRKGRETLLFDALTEFMKVSALQSMDEIVGYYSHKYKRSQTPHVVNHYAAGARLIGLTERQLKEHLEHLKASNAATGRKGLNSPYAQPLHILNSTTSLSSTSEHPQRTARTKPHRGHIRLSFKLESSKDGPGVLGDRGSLSRSKERPQHQNKYQLKLERGAHLHHVPVGDRGFGWASKRTEHIEVRLPPVHLRKLVPFDDLTAEDLPAIRTNVSNATREYRHERSQTQLLDDYKHWKALEVNLISPKILRNHFRVVFSHYSHVPQRHLTVAE